MTDPTKSSLMLRAATKAKENKPDAIAVVVGGAVEIVAALGLVERLDLTPTDVARIGAALVAIAGAWRMAGWWPFGRKKIVPAAETEDP